MEIFETTTLKDNIIFILFMADPATFLALESVCWTWFSRWKQLWENYTSEFSVNI